MGAAVGPPALGGKPGRALLGEPSDEQHRQPLHAGHKDGTGGRGVVARLDVGQASRFAGTRGAQIFQLQALGLLPAPLVPNDQSLLSSLLPLAQLSAGSLPQKAADEASRPLGGMQQEAPPFGAGWGVLCREQIAPSLA